MKKLSKGALIGIIAAAAVVVLTVILVLVESLSVGKLVIENKSGRNIESFSVYFIGSEEGVAVDTLFQDKLDNGEKININYGEKLTFGGYEAECVMYVKFEDGEPITIADGYFTKEFFGNFKFVFTEEDGELYLTARASEGIFRNTAATLLDSEYELWPEDGDWEDVDGFYDDDEDIELGEEY